MFGLTKSPDDKLKEALKYLEAGNLDKSISRLLDLAKENHAEAEYWLGDINEFTLKNLPEAANWYKRAADHGHARSKWCLADQYMTGAGVQFNYREAFRLYHEAAKQNIPEAQFILGEYYRTGYQDIIQKNTDKALLWYQRSAQAGNENATIRIEQFWPDGVFRDRRTPNAPGNEEDVDQTQETNTVECSELFNLIVDMALEQQYIPSNEFPTVPELRIYKIKIVELVCSKISDRMSTQGLDDTDMCKVFTYVFRQGFYDMRRWHESSDGQIGEVMVSDPFSNDFYLKWSGELRTIIDAIPAPTMIFDITRAWWIKNSGDLHSKGLDIWAPLGVALDLTYGIAVSVALKIFGYRN